LQWCGQWRDLALGHPFFDRERYQDPIFEDSNPLHAKGSKVVSRVHFVMWRKEEMSCRITCNHRDNARIRRQH